VKAECQGAIDLWKKTAYANLRFSSCSHQNWASGNFYATYTYPARHTAVGGRPGVALAIKIALWPASRRYKRGAGKFQLLFSVDHQSVGIPGPIVTAMVVVPQVN